MSIKLLLGRVVSSKNPYEPHVIDIIKETNYISWRSHLRNSAQLKLPFFFKLLKNIDRSINLPLFKVIEMLFLNDEKMIPTKNTEFIPSCYRNSSLPPIGVLVLSLYGLIVNKPTQHTPIAIHKLGYAAELINIAFEIHKCILNSYEKSYSKLDLKNKLINNKYSILLGDYLFAESSAILASLSNPDIVGCMSKTIIDISRQIAEYSVNNSNIYCNYEQWVKNNDFIVGYSVPYSFQSLALFLNHFIPLNRTIGMDVYFNFGRDLNNFFLINHLYGKLVEFKNTKFGMINCSKYDELFFLDTTIKDDIFITNEGLNLLGQFMNDCSINFTKASQTSTIDLSPFIEILIDNCLKKRAHLICTLHNYLNIFSPKDNIFKSFYKNLIKI